MQRKREYSEMLRKLHLMKRKLGEGTDKAQYKQIKNVMKKPTNIKLANNDQFEIYRHQYLDAVTAFESAKRDGKQAQQMVSKHNIKTAVLGMQKCVSSLKFNINQRGKTPQKQIELAYKQLELANAKKIYIQINPNFLKKKKNENTHHIRVDSLDDLRNRTKDLSQQSNNQGDSFQNGLIQIYDEMDEQVDDRLRLINIGLEQTIKKNRTISSVVHQTHLRVVAAVAEVQQNRSILEVAIEKQKKAMKYLNQPGCIANLILLAIIAVFGFLIASKFIKN